jgi:hypothetical protein
LCTVHIIIYVVQVCGVCVGEIYSTSIRPPELPLLFYKTQLSCYAFNRWPPEAREKGAKERGHFDEKNRKSMSWKGTKRQYLENG